jgi:hypothetical protein
MNVPAGFTTAFNLYYAAVNVPGSVTVWDGLGATGSVLATLNLPATGSNCLGSPKAYSCWVTVGATFSGTAKSVSFSGAVNQIAFDNISLGTSTPPPSPTPIPPTLLLVSTGLGISALYEAKRRFTRRRI